MKITFKALAGAAGVPFREDTIVRPSPSRLWVVPGLAALLLVLLPPAHAQAQALGKWVPNAGLGYELGGNPEATHRSPDGGYLRSMIQAPQGVGYLRTRVSAGPFLGKRVRLSGFVKTESAEGWASLSIRVVGPNGVWLAADTMEDRHITGTTDWGKYSLVVDVPAASTDIVLTMRFFGAGKAWVDGVTLESVGSEVALTDWPGKWTAGGSPRVDYEGGGNPAAAHGSPDGGYVRSKTATTKGTGRLDTWVVAVPYIGHRVRLSAYVRTENIERAAGLIVWVGGANNAMLAFDNMGDRPIKGTTGWKKYNAVVDVPSDTTNLVYGLFLDGAGVAWIDGVTIDMVGPEVALTGEPAWFPTGQNPEDYEMGGNPRVAHGADGGGYIRSKVETPKTFGSWASTSPVGSLRGKRMRLSGYVRTEGAAHAAVWMRVDGPNSQALAFDNMDERPIKGTTDWKKYDLVLDVAPQAVNVVYGIMLSGRGSVWIDGVTLDPVALDVASTNMLNPYLDYNEGRYAEAAALLPAATTFTPASYTPLLFRYLSLHRSGQTQEARTYIASIAERLSGRTWAEPVALFYAGRLSEGDVLKAAASADLTIDAQQRCEAYYYLAMAYLLKLGGVQGDTASRTEKAREYLKKCVATGIASFVEYEAARAELDRFK